MAMAMAMVMEDCDVEWVELQEAWKRWKGLMLEVRDYP